MSNGFGGKVAIVTAASRGIGRATAERLARDGARVAINYVGNRDKAREVVDAISKAGQSAMELQGDVADAAAVEALFTAVEQRFGPIDIVVNCAGYSVFKPLAEAGADDVAKSVSVNLQGALNVMQQAARRVRDGGRIVHISTGGTAMPMAGAGLYAGTKAAGELMALCLAKELGSRGITVNVVSPGVTNTDGLTIPAAQRDQLVAQTPLGRLGEPADIADVIAFLCSADARWITGQVVKPNGGIV